MPALYKTLENVIRHCLHFLFSSKFVSIFLFTLLIQVSYSVNAQEITLKRKNMPLIALINELQRQSGYTFIWRSVLISKSMRADADFHRTPLKTVLDQCLSVHFLTYKILKSAVVIKSPADSTAKGIHQLAPSAKLITGLQDRLSGRVLDEKGHPLAGASVSLKGIKGPLSSDKDGKFSFPGLFKSNYQLQVSHIGYMAQEVKVYPHQFMELRLVPKAETLQSVTVYSTGYEHIPKERATGSFSHIDNKLINRNTAVNVLDRLEGIASGLLLNRNLQNGANNALISIRGRSTIFGNAEPLIVLDGLPYAGSIDQINPADISSIDLLKDAAAASIWGTGSGNGVLVITSKKGRENQRLNIGWVSTLTTSGKPDLYYLPSMRPKEFIGLEQYLFDKGYYDNTLSSGYQAVSPAVALMEKHRDNEIGLDQLHAGLAELEAHDVREDLLRYGYRNRLYRQYQLSLQGGGAHHTYYLSGGYDKKLENEISNSFKRFTLNSSQSLSLLKGALELSSDMNFYRGDTRSTSRPYRPMTPYDRLADAQGNSLPVANILRLSYVDTAGKGKLLDWRYHPKDEFLPDVFSDVVQYRVQMGLRYRLIQGLNLSAHYQHLKENRETASRFGLERYHTRNLINTYSSIRQGEVSRAIPLGDILEDNTSALSVKTLRLQLSLNKVLKKNHELNAIAGYEGSDSRNILNDQIYYGYNRETLQNQNNMINPLIAYPYYYSPSSSSFIATAPYLLERSNIAESLFGNLSYSYKQRYILSASLRKDKSNLFAQAVNRGVPLYSAGLAWILNRENTWGMDWLPGLKLRLSYGHNGNVDKSVTGLLTVLAYGLKNPFGSLYSGIINPPNPGLKWEKVKIWNLGADFQFRDNRISGSLDVYRKYAVDLIGNLPVAMQSGVTQYRGNGATVQTRGIDLLIHSRNLIGAFQWNSSLLFNYNTDRVTRYDIKALTNMEIVQSNYKNPLVGYPYYAVFSFPSAGLDASGQPQGFLHGERSQNYSEILLSLDPAELKYHGSASPKYFGSLTHTFAYRRLELSLNLGFKLGYYFRRENVFSGGSYEYLYLNYDKRWQQPGDERFTRIPALTFPQGMGYGFFANSEDLVEKGDHLRLQDIRFSYQFRLGEEKNALLKNAELFLYARNLGILWRDNNWHIDPDYGTLAIPEPLTCSLGINFNL